MSSVYQLATTKIKTSNWWCHCHKRSKNGRVGWGLWILYDYILKCIAPSLIFDWNKNVGTLNLYIKTKNTLP